MSKKAKCSFVMDKFLEIDKHQRIPLWITNHLLTCEECRTNVRMFTQAEKSLITENDTENPFTYATLSDVKEKLYPGSTKPKKIPLLFWLIIGVILLVCMIFCAIFSNKYIPAIQSYSFIFIAAVVTTYCMVFIGMNMDLFVKQ